MSECKIISVVIPAYKEAENLSVLLPRLNSVLADIPGEHEVLIVDTQKPLDDTKSVCSENGANHVARRGGNSYGDAIRTGFAQAGGKYTVVMDADGSHEPEVIRKMLCVMIKRKCDLVIGSRYCKGGYTDNNIVLRGMSLLLNSTYRILFNVKAKDVSNSFRMYRSEQIKKLNLKCDNFDIVEEILIELCFGNKDMDIREIPIRFNKRQAGDSKRELFTFIISYLCTILRLMRMKLAAKNGFFGRGTV
ncbi:MAG: glycosyltransferase [Ruminococcus sp.]|nr:glycosyltransferase [Ruminococcus sp.]